MIEATEITPFYLKVKFFFFVFKNIFFLVRVTCMYLLLKNRKHRWAKRIKWKTFIISLSHGRKPRLIPQYRSFEIFFLLLPHPPLLVFLVSLFSYISFQVFSSIDKCVFLHKWAYTLFCFSLFFCFCSLFFCSLFFSSPYRGKISITLPSFLAAAWNLIAPKFN